MTETDLSTDLTNEIKAEVKKLVELATGKDGVLNIEHLRTLSLRKAIEFKKNGKPANFIKGFKLMSKKAEGKTVNVSGYSRFSDSKGEVINIKDYLRTLPSDKHKKPEQLTMQDFWDLKHEFVKHIESQDLTEKQQKELINGLPQEIVYTPYVYQRKPTQLIELFLQYRKRLDELIEMKKSENKKFNLDEILQKVKEGIEPVHKRRFDRMLKYVKADVLSQLKPTDTETSIIPVIRYSLDLHQISDKPIVKQPQTKVPEGKELLFSLPSRSLELLEEELGNHIFSSRQMSKEFNDKFNISVFPEYAQKTLDYIQNYLYSSPIRPESLKRSLDLQFDSYDPESYPKDKIEARNESLRKKIKESTNPEEIKELKFELTRFKSPEKKEEKTGPTKVKTHVRITAGGKSTVVKEHERADDHKKKWIPPTTLKDKFNTPEDARKILREYKVELVALKQMATSAGGLDNALKNPEYIKRRDANKARQSQYFKMVKEFQGKEKVGQFGAGKTEEKPAPEKPKSEPEKPKTPASPDYFGFKQTTGPAAHSDMAKNVESNINKHYGDIIKNWEIATKDAPEEMKNPLQQERRSLYSAKEMFMDVVKLAVSEKDIESEYKTYMDKANQVIKNVEYYKKKYSHDSIMQKLKSDNKVVETEINNIIKRGKEVSDKTGESSYIIGSLEELRKLGTELFALAEQGNTAEFNKAKSGLITKIASLSDKMDEFMKKGGHEPRSKDEISRDIAEAYLKLKEFKRVKDAGEIAFWEAKLAALTEESKSVDSLRKESSHTKKETKIGEILSGQHK